MNFSSFSDSLQTALHNLESITQPNTIGPFIPAGKPHTKDNTEKPVLGASISIGIHQYPQNSDPLNLDYVILNNKNSAVWGKGNWESVTGMITALNANSWAAIRKSLKIQEETDPEALLDKIKIYIEDVSPDTVFSFYLLLLKLACVEESVFNNEFIQGVQSWEAGHTWCTGEYIESWPILQAASVQQYSEVKDKNPSFNINSTWIRSLYLLNHIAKKKYSIHAIDRYDYFPQLHQARNAVETEKQLYANALQRSETLQLLLPLRGSTHREKLLDAFFLEEEIISGVLKVYARDDKVNSFFGTGYGILVMNHENEDGTGDELSISADAREGIQLCDLWINLEKKEWKLRPSRAVDDPRKLPYLYSLFDDNKIVRTNQPWYMNPSFDLIAAPRPDSAELKRGTCFNWKEFKSIIWETYNPGKNILVSEYCIDNEILIKGSSAPLVQLSEGTENTVSFERKDSKTIRAYNYDPENMGLSFLLTPTIKRIFAALIITPNRNVGIDDLPASDEFDFYQISGGFIIAHEKGVLAFNDWHKAQLDIHSLIKEFKMVRQKYEFLEGIKDNASVNINESIENRIEKAIVKLKKPEKIWQLISCNMNSIGIRSVVKYLRTMILDPLYTKKYPNNTKLLMWLNRVKIEIDKTLSETETTTAFKSLRDIIETRWGISHTAEELYESVARLEETLRTASELRTEGLIFMLSFYGFPFAFLGSFFSGILSGWIENPALRKSISALASTVHVSGLLLYLVLSFIFIVVLRIIYRNKK